MTIPNISTEAIFYSGTSTTKGGHKATFQVEGRDVIEDLEAIGPGKRFMMVLAPIADDETPDVEVMQRKSLANMAGILSNHPPFWEFIGIPVTDNPRVNADAAANHIRRVCNVNSRSEIKHGTLAGDVFNRLKTDFDEWSGRIPKR